MARSNACVVVSALVAFGLGSGCAKSSSATTTTSTSAGLLPLVTPIVKASLPSGLGGTAAGREAFEPRKFAHLLDLNDNGAGNGTQLSTDIGNLQSRFFSSQGPTEIMGQLLPTLDSLITNVNTIAASSSDPCLTQTPVGYTINPANKVIEMYAQCYYASTPQYQAGTDGDTNGGGPNSGGGNAYGSDPAFMQFGVRNGIIYIYSANGAEWIAAIVNPLGSAYTVTAYIGVGYTNFSMTGTHGGDWDSGSYGLIEFNANSLAGTFELAVAGGGLGFCGAQLQSDGKNIYAIVSNDMGTTCGTNGQSDDLCVLAGDVTTASSQCAGSSVFTLNPIGREGGVPSSGNSISQGQTYGASTYPAVLNTIFNGTASDSIHFGPIVPTTGVGQLSGAGGGAANAGKMASAITALNGALAGDGYNSTEQSCADTAAQNS